MDDRRINVLLIEDELPDADIVREMLADAPGDNFTLEHTPTLSDGLDRLTAEDFDVILLDLSLPDSQEMETLASVQGQAPHIPIVVLSGAKSEALAVQSVQEGAQDYLTKGQADSNLLARAIRYAIERKQTEERLRESKKFLENILESLTHPFYVVNIDDYTIEIANSAAAPMEKLSKNATCYGVTHHAQAPCNGTEHPCPIEEIKTSRAPVTMEHIHYEPDGLPHHVEVHGYPIFDAEGNVSQMIEYTQDITERKHAERALRRERDLVARLMDTSPVSITMVNRKGEIIFANARAQEVLGLSKGELMQRTYHAPEWRITAFDGEPFPKEKLPFQQVMRTGQPIYDVRHAIEWPDGQRVLLSINGAPLLDEEGHVERVVFAIEDVTEQVQAERKRIEQFKREIHAIEQIAALPNTVVSARSFGATPLREKLPDIFGDLIKDYKELLDKALERKVYKMEDTISDDARKLANRLGTLNAKPRDVIDVHITALKERSEQSNALKSEAYAEEGRLITLELMGHLVSYYRNRCDTSHYFPHGAEEREEL